MEIKATPEEIAALIAALQERQVMNTPSPKRTSAKRPHSIDELAFLSACDGIKSQSHVRQVLGAMPRGSSQEANRNTASTLGKY